MSYHQGASGLGLEAQSEATSRFAEAELKIADTFAEVETLEAPVLETYKRRLSQSSGCCFIQFSACKRCSTSIPYRIIIGRADEFGSKVGSKGGRHERAAV